MQFPLCCCLRTTIEKYTLISLVSILDPAALSLCPVSESRGNPPKSNAKRDPDESERT